MQHQYIDRKTGQVRTEKIFRDKLVNFVYSSVRENASFCFNLVVSQRSSALLSYLAFDFSFNWNRKQVEAFIENMGIDMSDCVLPLDCFLTPRQVFQRKIRYWACRPMPEAQTEPFSTKDDIQDNGIVVSPSDAKVLVGDLKSSAPLFIKGKFFEFEELLEKQVWTDTFKNGQYAIFRLTPDEYHYNHAPVTGWVADFYEINGKFHACNPGAVVREVTPYSKNTRVVTIFNTDIQGGTCVGRVAMIEVAAMMVGQIDQCYSSHCYDSPCDMHPGMIVRKGQPKSLFRPGSSTVILLFEAGRIRFSRAIVKNMNRTDAQSRFSQGFGAALVETAVRVREAVASSALLHIQKGGDNHI